MGAVGRVVVSDTTEDVYLDLKGMSPQSFSMLLLMLKNGSVFFSCKTCYGESACLLSITELIMLHVTR